MTTTAFDRAKQLLRETVVPGDVVAGILAASKLKRIPSNELLLASSFYEFAKEKPHLFADFDFFAGGTYPFSDVLQEQLTHFETEHVLGKPNPTYREHEIKVGSNESEWIQTWVFDKLERRGWLDDVKDLGARLRERVEAIEAKRSDDAPNASAE